MRRDILPENEWAVREFEGADLGDKRREERLVKVAAEVARVKSGIMAQVFSEKRDLKAAYRLLAEEDVTHEDVIRPHVAETRRICREAGTYLLIEDTTALDFSARENVEGLGYIGDGRGRGINVHTTLAARVADWGEHEEPRVVLCGMFGQRRWVRKREPIGRGESERSRLSRERESERWAAAFSEIEKPPSDCRLVYIADRESDIYEVFSRCENKGVNYVIRASHRRALADEDGSVFDAVAESSLLGCFELRLRSRPGVKARIARIEVRSTSVTLRGPWRPGGWLGPRTLNVVEAREANAPRGVKPIHWVLLTDLPRASFKDALRVIRTYSRRWLIEEYHKVLKTGLGMEDSQLSTVERITALLGILAVTAVRLLNMKLLVEAAPDGIVCADDFGVEALELLSARFGKPKGGWNNRAVFVAIARLGGFLARKGDGLPGWQRIWRGYQRFLDMLEGFEIARHL